jgi:hypothetical protein
MWEAIRVFQFSLYGSHGLTREGTFAIASSELVKD